jgi:hypothetical protein
MLVIVLVLISIAAIVNRYREVLLRFAASLDDRGAAADREIE